MQRKIWIALLLTLGLGGLGIAPLFFVQKPACPAEQTAAKPTKKATVTMPDLPRLAMAAEGGLKIPTDVQLQEDREIQNEQIRQAKEWLASPDLQERITGAEQLSAYPTPEAERYLVQALTTDSDDAVRIAAAESLSYIKSPHPPTIDALIAAMHAMDDDLRASAFNALQSILHDTDAKTGKKITAKLKDLASKGSLDTETKEMLQDFLKDQEAS